MKFFCTHFYLQTHIYHNTIGQILFFIELCQGIDLSIPLQLLSSVLVWIFKMLICWEPEWPLSSDKWEERWHLLMKRPLALVPGSPVAAIVSVSHVTHHTSHHTQWASYITIITRHISAALCPVWGRGQEVLSQDGGLRWPAVASWGSARGRTLWPRATGAPPLLLTHIQAGDWADSQ